MRRRRQRWPMAISHALIGALTISAGCVTKPAPNGPDGRPCWVGQLDSTTAMLLRAQSPPIYGLAGDLIQTQACAQQMSHDLLLETYELTRTSPTR